MNHYDFTLGPLSAQQVPALGSYVKLLSASGRVRVRTNAGDSYSLLEGQGFRMPEGKAFSDLTLTDLSGAGNVGVIFVGEASFEDSRVSGTVSITNKIGATIAQTFGSGSLALGVTVGLPIVTPAANARGVRVRSALTSVTGNAGGIAELRLVAAPTQPTNNFPANGYSFAAASSPGAGTVVNNLQQLNFELPAGWGLWPVSTNTAVAPSGAGFEFAYELL